jgi:OOP family OmpA-OmpF porin
MRKEMRTIAFWALVGVLGFSLAVYAQEGTTSNLVKLTAGQKAEMTGIIVQRDADSFVLRDLRGNEVLVKIYGVTEIKEKKSNPFRGAKKYTSAELVRGLNVDVEGMGDAEGALSAQEIRFTQTEFLIAKSVESRVKPVEGRLSDTEERLTRAEENAQHLSGQVQELNAISDAARSGAKAAQLTADEAVQGVAAANTRITETDQTLNARITAVDDFELKESVTVNFKVDSAALSADAMTQLEQLAKEALVQKGYVVEVTGYASSEGDEAYNRMLSQRRADAVVRYLAESSVPLRRIVTPFGFGEKQPVADNSTRTGREQNRRVEVKILTSRGLAAVEAATGSERNR